jgi:hypothetical protein
MDCDTGGNDGGFRSRDARGREALGQQALGAARGDRRDADAGGEAVEVAELVVRARARVDDVRVHVQAEAEAARREVGRGGVEARREGGGVDGEVDVPVGDEDDLA